MSSAGEAISHPARKKKILNLKREVSVSYSRSVKQMIFPGTGGPLCKSRRPRGQGPHSRSRSRPRTLRAPQPQGRARAVTSGPGSHGGRGPRAEASRKPKSSRGSSQGVRALPGLATGPPGPQGAAHPGAPRADPHPAATAPPAAAAHRACPAPAPTGERTPHKAPRPPDLLLCGLSQLLTLRRLSL